VSNVHIPLEHQSSPKETDADKLIKRGVEEIATGQFTPDMTGEVWLTGTEALAQHPAVQEALQKLTEQVADRTSNEYLEKAEQLHELNQASMLERQWPGQKRWQGKEMEDMRKVNPMSPSTFIGKLKAIGIKAEIVPHEYFGTALDENGVERAARIETSDGICLGTRVVRDLVGLFAQVPQPDGSKKYERVDKLQVPLGPEWSLIRFDDYGVPIGEKFHGWRTAVLALIKARVITEEQAHKAFGKPVENAASSFYREQLFHLRNEAAK
jgi:hypothetical protein